MRPGRSRPAHAWRVVAVVGVVALLALPYLAAPHAPLTGARGLSRPASPKEASASPGTPSASSPSRSSGSPGSPATPATVSTTLAVSYNLTFSAVGLPSSADWEVNLSGTFWGATGAELTVALSNGTYDYEVLAPSGYEVVPAQGNVTVAGADVNVTLTFSLGSGEYVVTFAQSGLPLGEYWSAYLSGAFGGGVSGEGATQEIPVPNGTYNFTVVADEGGWTATPAAGVVTVAGRNATVNVTFARAALVTFSESGLAFGAGWNVALGDLYNASTGPNISFYEAPGSYPFTVGGPAAYLPTPESGTVVVTAAGVNVSVVFSLAPGEAQVTFESAGLPPGLLWGVSLGNASQFSRNTSIGFVVPYGTYSFYVDSPGGYVAAPISGTLTVHANATLSVTFHAIVLYPLTFVEAGLPPGTPWAVRLNTSVALLWNDSETTNVGFEVPNGTVGYAVLDAENGSTVYVASVGFGNLTVDGAGATVEVTFAAAELFPVTVTERGLPSGTEWAGALYGNLTSNLTVGATVYTTGTSIVFDVPNGSYLVGAYSLSSTFYDSSPSPATVVVEGGAGASTVTFLPEFAVWFNETGLPYGTGWSFSITGPGLSGTATFGGTGSGLGTFLANGTYDYVPSAGAAGYAAQPGSFTVDGANLTVTIAFARSYTVLFLETGLPAGSSWYVNLTGWVSLAGNGSSLSFGLPNGSFDYAIGSSDRLYAAAPSSVVVAGVAEAVEVAFHLVEYSVTFTETGLPSGTAWYVNLTGGVSLEGTTTALTASLSNGSYRYTVSMAGRSFSATGGSVSVAGGAVERGVGFALVTYAVTFSASGLPAGATWYVNLTDGTTVSGTASSEVVDLPNGTYRFAVGITDKEYAAGAGAFTVDGASGSVTVTFFEVTYAVTFTQSGLHGAYTWYVDLSGTVYSSTGLTLTVNLPNGSYAFSLNDTGRWVPLTSAFATTVSGSAVAEAVKYVYTYPLVFDRPSGAPDGTNWSVTLSGPAVLPSVGASGPTASRSGTSSTLMFAEPNGTYAYTVRVTGFDGYNRTGTTTVEGSGTTIPTGSVRSATSSPPPYWLYGVAAAVVAAAVAVAALLLRRRLPPAEPAGDAASTPRGPGGSGTDSPSGRGR